MRAGPFKTLMHTKRSDSKFFLGKNKVIQVALGKTPEEEHAPNTSQISKYLKGHICLLASNKSKEDVNKALKELEVEDFAVSGAIADFTVFLEKGLTALDAYTHSLEPYLKQLGLPVKLNFQKLELMSDVYVCREGQVINVE